jgi:hypothetical protein
MKRGFEKVKKEGVNRRGLSVHCIKVARFGRKKEVEGQVLAGEGYGKY